MVCTLRTVSYHPSSAVNLHYIIYSTLSYKCPYTWWRCLFNIKICSIIIKIKLNSLLHFLDAFHLPINWQGPEETYLFPIDFTFFKKVKRYERESRWESWNNCMKTKYNDKESQEEEPRTEFRGWYTEVRIV